MVVQVISVPETTPLSSPVIMLMAAPLLAIMLGLLEEDDKPGILLANI
jgi:hypothetical protein